MTTKNSISLFFIILVVMIGNLGHISGDIYLSSMPAIKQTFNSSSASVQLSLSLFMFGFGISHLFYGPISDRIGRRKPILFGIGLSVLGTLICLLSPNIVWLICGRILQGIGLGACNSVGKSIGRDLLSGEQLAKFAAQMGMVSAFAIASAPAIGGYIQRYFGWRANFLFILIYSIIIFTTVWSKLPETNQYLNHTATQFRVLIKNYFTLLKSRIFIGNAFCSSLALAGIFAYLAVTPFLLHNLGLSPVQFGWWAFAASFCIFFSALTNNRFVVEKGIQKMMTLGIYTMLAAGLLMLIFMLLGFVDVWVIMLPVLLFIFGAGLTFSNAFAGAFHPFPKMAGAASALFGCIQVFGGFIGGSVMAAFRITNQLPLAIVLCVIALAALFSLKFIAHE